MATKKTPAPIPEFDPNEPFSAGNEIPEFDPTAAFQVEGGPAFFQEQQPQVQESDIEDQPADLSGRFAMKAFGGDTPSKIKYYQQKNPEKDVMENPYNKGEIIARVKGTTKWLKEDPFTGSWLQYPEVINDITDLAWDIPAGIAQGAATTAGFLGGTVAAPFTGPAAPIVPFAGATAAGTATGQGIEALRQGIGSAFFGQKQEMPSTGSTAAAQALTNLLFGVGGPTGQIAKTIAKNPDVAKRALESASKYFIPKGAKPTPEEAQMATEFLQNTITNKGLLRKVKGKFLPAYFGGDELNIATAMEDAPQKLVNDLISKGVKIDPKKKWSFRELSQAVELQGKGKGPGQVALDEIKNSVNQAKQVFSQKFDRSLEAIPVKFDVEKYKAPLLKRLDQLSKDSSEAANYEANQIKSILGEYFSPKKVKMEVPQVSTEQVAGLVDEAGKPIMKQVTGTKEVFVPGSTNWSAQSLQSLANRLTDLTDPQQTFAQAQKKTVTSKLDAGAIAETANLIRNDIYGAIKDKSLRKDYKSFMDLQKNVMDGFSNEKKAATTLSNAFNRSTNQKAMLQSLREFDKKMKTNLESSAKLAWVGKRFGDPSLEQVSGTATSTSRVMRPGAAGALMGSAAGSVFGPVGAGVGGLVGGGVGALSATDAVLNQILSASEKLRRSPVGQGIDYAEQSKWLYPQQVIPWLNLQLQRNQQQQNQTEEP